METPNKDLPLFKQFVDELTQQPQTEPNPFARAEEVAKQLGLIEESTPDPKSDIARLVKHYKGKKMSKQQLRKAIGHDLEMLEYNPDDVAKMVKQVLTQCC